VVEILPFFLLNVLFVTFFYLYLCIINLNTKQMVNTNFSNQTTNQLLTEYQFKVEALQNKIEELKAILEINNLT
tara:strand:+ start:2346 stop:2567 length:222 start_codon:yes stop_codon:yes gene_type:complete